VASRIPSITKNHAMFFALFWVTVAGIIIRVWGLSKYSYSPDDALHLYLSDWANIQELWQHAVLAHARPPLIYLFVRMFMLFSKQELFLRLIFLIPGMGLVFAFYFLGLKASGAASGFAMACIAAFSRGTILLSQVVREYMLLLLFLSAGYWFFLSFLKDRRNGSLFGCVFFLGLSLLTSYAALISIAAFGLAHLLLVAFRREKMQELKALLLAYLPLALLAGTCYFFHARLFLRSDLYEKSANTYLLPFFPGDLAGWLHNFLEFYEYIFLKPFAVWMILLSGLGLFAILRKRQYAIGAVIVLPFFINFLLTFFHKFPFGGARQSIFLLPSVALLVGAAVQFLYDAAKRLLAVKSPPTFAWIENHSSPILLLATGILLGLSLQLMFMYKETDFLRRYPGTHGASRREFPIEKETYLQLMNALRRESNSHDIVLTNNLTAYYLLWNEGESSPFRAISANLKEGRYGDRSFYFTDRIKIESKEQLLASLQELRGHVDLPQEPKILLLNIGWGDGVRDELLNWSALDDSARRIQSLPGGFLFSLDAQILCTKLTKNSGETASAEAAYEDIVN
jgi:hypothetical protein